MPTPNPPAFDALIAAALREDLGRGDVTTRLCVPAAQGSKALLLARRPGVAAGLTVFAAVFKRLDKRVRVSLLKRDGQAFRAGETLARLQGPARALLTGERVALNFCQRLCGIATLTRAYVAAARRPGKPVQLLDTRKTTPLLRSLEKHAVACGGGVNHRLRLDSAVLIKDNHIKAAGSVAEAVRRARRSRLLVEVEVETLAELQEALVAGADMVLLDNFPLTRLQKAVRQIRLFNAVEGRRVLSEASGGVDLATVGRIAATGVDSISVGALTHSAPALDLSLEFLPE